MKIALVSTGMPFGGTTTFSLFLAVAMKELGVPMKIISLGLDHPMEGEFLRLQVPVYRCDDRKLVYEDRLKEALEQLRAFAPTVIISNLANPAFEILRYVPNGIFRIGMLQDHHPAMYQMARIYCPFVDRFAAVSRTIQDELAKKSPEIPCSYLPYGILPGSNERRSSSEDQPIRILYFGRLQQHQKQVQMFPEIWRALKSQKIPFQWTILGEGPEEQFLRENLAEGVRAGEIVFSPPIFNRQELSRKIAAHDIFLLCSLHEGLPLALLEAMGHGLVPVCGDIPSLAHGAIAPDNGFLIPQKDPNAYAETIASLHRDRPLLERMSANSVALFEREYTAIAMARRYIEVIKKHASQAEPSPWPSTFFPRPPLSMEKTWYMKPQLLPLRRLFKRFKSSRG